MKIYKTDFVAGAKNAEGLVVVIDVFRAFSVACYAYQQGASRVLPVGSVELAREISASIPNSLLIGERGGKKLPGFDFGNSPSEIISEDLSGKTLIHTTHAGTQGLVNAKQADEVITGSFVNAKAIANYISAKTPKIVTLVRMGLETTSKTDEDDLCADYLESLLAGTPMDERSILDALKTSPTSARFFDPLKPESPSVDFDLCLKFNQFDFVLKAINNDQGLLELKRID